MPQPALASKHLLPCLALVLVAPAAAQQAAPLTEAQRTAFAVVEAFDPSPPGPHPFVAVTRRDDGETLFHAFQIAANETTVEVCRVALRREAIDRREWFVLPVDPAVVLRDAIGTGQPPLDALLLARACARLGDLAAVHEAWASLPGDLANDPTGDAALAKHFAHHCLAAFTDRSLSWADLLDLHDRWLETFEGLLWAGVVQGRRDAIHAVVQRKATRRVDACRSTETLVQDLCDEFDLEDHRLLGPCVMRPTRRGTGAPPTPAERVIARGVAAVPALIAALEDRGLTRCVIRPRWALDYEPRRLGELAELVLERIAGFRPHNPHGRVDWQAWLAEVRGSDIDTVLARHAAQGDSEALASYYRRHPNATAKVLAWAPAGRCQLWTLRALLRAAPDPVPQPIVEHVRAFVDQLGDPCWAQCLRADMTARGIGAAAPQRHSRDNRP